MRLSTRRMVHTSRVEAGKSGCIAQLLGSRSLLRGRFKVGE